MAKTTMYLPEETEIRLDAEAANTGVSKGELIRCGFARPLEASDHARDNASLPVFRSGRSRSADETREDIYLQIEQRTSARGARG
ncbi:hypothetical protein [Nocardia testacea]|uniref:CopG family transcriptional regulator n=1 Tax=Nocardia testacea TaxID=248551 RepID=A0ABW7W146_9NOCA